MNPQIRRLFYVLVGLFVALVAMSSYWLWDAPNLEAKRGNPNLLVKQLTIKRGLIYASDGRTVLAKNRKLKKKGFGRPWYLRVYPRGDLAAHPVGYSTIERSRTGIEKSFNDYLTGSNANLDTVVDNTLDKLRGLTQEGNNLVTTLNLRGQRAAMQGLAGKCGAAVAIEPSTGRVLVIASQPSYNPNLVEGHFGRIVRQAAGAPCRPPSPLLNRGTQGLFIPGSTFKVITAAAALDTGRFTPQSRFTDPGYCIEYGKRVSNFADQSGPEVFGNVDFVEALQHSINAVFCNIGKALGAATVLEYAQRFGFYEEPPIELPSEEIAPSGLYRRGRLYLPKDPNAVDPGRLAFGQERLLATPLQMALVAAGIANHGVVMRPTLLGRIETPDGKVIERTNPEKWKDAIKPRTAAELTAMMEAVVQGGTGTAAQIPGVSVAGKTGTAETGRSGHNDTWFIAFAPADRPRVAVAVALSDQSGTGGTTAAPIAKAIMEAILRRNP
ncbi:MAG TPA: penicillin-binding protein 2 [Gaiellaceae bacterium]